MTAEIAVVNTRGIALAADSAVTIGSRKIYNSANKLFTLSKHHPVGIMIYGNADFMGIPWETIIKTYRNEVLKETSFPALSDYADNFLEYLRTTPYIAVGNETIFIESTIHAFLNFIKNSLEDGINERYKSDTTPIKDSEIANLLGKILGHHVDNFTPQPEIKNVTVTFKKNVKTRIRPIFEDIKIKVFEKMKIGKAHTKLMFEACQMLFYKSIFRNRHSGIVIAGFGSNEIYPRVSSFLIEGKIEKVLKFKIDDQGSFDCDFHHSASILPYAQREMVDTFMCGIDPVLRATVENTFDSLCRNFVDILTKHTEVKIGKTKKIEANAFMEQFRQNLRQNFEQEVLVKFVTPIVDSVSNLPLDELASMAHALVNLTSFKRRVSMNLESVGGPIDVAVISKGDGFVWIQRKHYFKPELNHHYFNNYFRKETL